jgi:uncharacterized BrkB/YihY/UPF0761 family membrane protein
MKTFSVLLGLVLFAFAPAKAQVAVDFSSPDKQKYLISGAFISGVTYAWASDYYTVHGKTNTKKARMIALGSAVGFGLAKEVFDFYRSGFRFEADDYLGDLSTLLLGSISITVTIKIFDSDSKR